VEEHPVPDFLIRGIDSELAERVKNLARDRNWALNDVMIYLLRKALGLVEGDNVAQPHRDIAQLGGTWAPEESQAFREALSAFENLPEDQSPVRAAKVD
jgi:hypothetical protein